MSSSARGNGYVVITVTGGAVVSTLWPRSADKVYRIVFVVPIGQFADANKVLVTAFLQGLREFGYVDGKNMKFEFYSAEGRFGEIDEIAACWRGTLRGESDARNTITYAHARVPAALSI